VITLNVIDYYISSLELKLELITNTINFNCVCSISGTFEAERKPDDIAFGLVHQVNSWNPVYVQVIDCICNVGC